MREFSVSLLGLELSTVFIKSLDSGIENVLLTFGEKKCSWERLSLVEGGVRIKNYFVELETSYNASKAKEKSHTEAGVSAGQVQNGNSQVGGSPSRRDLGLVEDQKVVDHKSAVLWCLEKWIMDVPGAVQCPGVHR